MGSPGGPPSLETLLNELRLAVQALNGLVAALRDASLTQPVQMQVERLEVQTLEFHLGDIDVQELQGELNIGITHSLRVASPNPQPEQGPTPEPHPQTKHEQDSSREHRVKPGGPGPQTLPKSVVTRWREQGGPPEDPQPLEQVTIWPPPESETEGKGEQ